MPETTILIGGREFQVACQEGEEEYLNSAAKMLDDEVRILVDQAGRMPESRMLLMAGLLLADKTAGYVKKIQELETQAKSQAEEIEKLQNQPDPEPVRIEVPSVPQSVFDTLEELSARAQSLAAVVEEKSTSQ